MVPKDRFIHRTTIHIGITCKNIPCCMRDSAYRFIDKTFLSYLENF